MHVFRILWWHVFRIRWWHVFRISLMTYFPRFFDDMFSAFLRWHVFRMSLMTCFPHFFDDMFSAFFDDMLSSFLWWHVIRISLMTCFPHFFDGMFPHSLMTCFPHSLMTCFPHFFDNMFSFLMNKMRRTPSPRSSAVCKCYKWTKTYWTRIAKCPHNTYETTLNRYENTPAQNRAQLDAGLWTSVFF